MYGRAVDFLNYGSIVVEEHFIFGKGLSVHRALHNIIDEILYVLNNKTPLKL
jgi:hypothetical protein